MSVFCGVINIVLSLTIVAVCLYTYRLVVRPGPGRYAYLIVFYYTVTRVILFLLVPAVLRLGSGWYYDRVVSVKPGEVVTVYVIEFISYSVWSMGFILVSKMRGGGRGLQQRRGDGRDRDAAETTASIRSVKLFIFVVLVLYLASLLDKMVLDSRIAESALGSLIAPVALLAGPAFGLYAMSFRQQLGLATFALGLLVSLLAIGYSLLFGVRGQALFYGTFLVFIFLFCNRSRFLLTVGALSMVIMVAFQAQMILLRADQSYTRGSISSMATTLLSSRKGEGGGTLLLDAESRLGEATRLSVAFVRLRDSGRGVGWRVIESALLAPIPRVVLPEKPEPGSSDGTKAGMGMYVIQDQIRGEFWNMSDFVTGAHAYWELGVLGVLIFGFLAGAFIAFCIKRSARLGMFGIVMAVMAMKPWAMESKLWTSEIVLQVFHLLLPLLALWFGARVAVQVRARVVRILRLVPSGKPSGQRSTGGATAGSTRAC